MSSEHALVRRRERIPVEKPLGPPSPSLELVTPVSALGWELRGHLVRGRDVRVVVSPRCDAIRRQPRGERVIEGRVTSVAATDAYVEVGGWRVPLEDVLAVVRTHRSQRPL